MRWKHFLVVGSILLFLGGCGGISYIGYKNQQLALQIDQNQLQLHGTLLTQKLDNFSSLFLYRKVIRLETGDIVVYEDARTEMSYQFEPTITRIVQVVFEAANIITVYTKNSLFAYQIRLNNGGILNVIAQMNVDQKLKLVYGMRTAQFNRMLKHLDPDAPNAYYRNVITLHDTKHAILTNWNVRNINFVPLVVPLSFTGALR